jgi:DNA-binding response OmpR family regulator
MELKPRIVVAEDDLNILQLLEHVLTVKGYEVTAAKDGEEALEAVRRLKPPLLIADVMMPRRNGYQLVQALRKERAAIKIILLTSKTDPADVRQGLDAGADVYIAKPFDIQEVISHVGVLLQGCPS